ncbi:MAG: DUF2283 domain-containing protein [Candidatus Blackburnbacteria bacterium]|nr:DUF2283 domain-containing protein [Candidatus Blackburnbacteria bacterium]
MKKAKKNNIYYDRKSDALWILVKGGVEEVSREVAPGVSVELDKKGELLGIEVLNASKVFKETLLGDKNKKLPISF